MQSLQRSIEQSLYVEDFLRRVFLVPLSSENLEELLNLIQNLDPKFAEHKFTLEFVKCKNKPAMLDEIRYEFNRLFVGPKRPKAEPYESVYFGYKIMFGTQTMQVRNFYESSGLRLEDIWLDKFPDDYIGYELQYLYFLSFSVLKTGYEAKFNEILRKKAEFIATHPSQWFDKFAAKCEEAANLDVWKSFGSFLNLYLNSEIDTLNAVLKDSTLFKNLKE